MEKTKLDLLTMGEVLLRLSPLADERLVRGDFFEKKIGGAELNVACGAALLGLKTGIISKLPDNQIGLFAKNKINACGVRDEFIVYDQESDARLGIYYYENGAYPRKPGIAYDRKNSSVLKLSADELDPSIYESCRCFHTTGITLALGEKVRETTIEMMKNFKKHGVLISFDVNFRGNLWTGKEAKECIEKILPLVDIFFCSESTARLTFEKEGDVRSIMKSFAEEYQIPVVASTQRIVHSPKRHSFGSVVYDAEQDRYFEEEMYKDIEVIDRIGSGDAYIAGMLYGLLAYDLDCEKAMEYGNASGAVKNTIPGDLPSSGKKELDQIIVSHKNTGPESEMDR